MWGWSSPFRLVHSVPHQLFAKKLGKIHWLMVVETVVEDRWWSRTTAVQWLIVNRGAAVVLDHISSRSEFGTAPNFVPASSVEVSVRCVSAAETRR